MERVRLSIPDLKCASCVADIEHLLRAQEGVVWAYISFAAREVAVIYDPATFDLLALVQALAQLGLRSRLSGGDIRTAGRLSPKQVRRVEQWMHAQ